MSKPSSNGGGTSQPQCSKAVEPQRRILIAMDGSAYSRRALEWYAEFLNHRRDYLVFVYVAEPPPVGVGDGLGMIRSAELFRRRLEAVVRRAKQMGNLLAEKCAQLEITQPYKFVECFGNSVGVVICNLAETESVSLILMGNRGLSFWRRTFLGSVSTYVLHHSSVPTIIVPPKPEPRNSLPSSESTWTSNNSSSDSESSVTTIPAVTLNETDGSIDRRSSVTSSIHSAADLCASN